jgi:hypothetical protein
MHFLSLVTNKILRLIQLLKFVANTDIYIYIYIYTRIYIYIFPLVASLQAMYTNTVPSLSMIFVGKFMGKLIYVLVRTVQDSWMCYSAYWIAWSETFQYVVYFNFGTKCKGLISTTHKQKVCVWCGIIFDFSLPDSANHLLYKDQSVGTVQGNKRCFSGNYLDIQLQSVGKMQNCLMLEQMVHRFTVVNYHGK